MDDMDYTDFANGETRATKHIHDSKFNEKEEIAKYNKIRSNAQKIIDILTHEN